MSLAFLLPPQFLVPPSPRWNGALAATADAIRGVANDDEIRAAAKLLETVADANARGRLLLWLATERAKHLLVAHEWVWNATQTGAANDETLNRAARWFADRDDHRRLVALQEPRLRGELVLADQQTLDLLFAYRALHRPEAALRVQSQR